jgi:hypothetical protein
MLPYEETVEKYKEAVRFGPDFIDAWYGPVLCIFGELPMQFGMVW